MSFRPFVTAAALAVFGASGTLANRAVAVLRAPAFSDGLPLRSATAVGMSAERLASVDRVVLSGIAAGGYPGAAVVVGRGGYSVVKRGYGHLGWTADSPAADEHSIYDLASLTKVVGTTAAIMVLYDEGKIDLDAPVGHYVPAFAGGMKDRVTVRHLLEHRSGLPAGRDLWRLTSSPAEARRAVLETPLYCRPGDCFEYSDLGADVLGFVVETVSGERMDAFLAQRVYGPLGMNDTYFRPPAPLRNRIAPTEVSPPRGYPLRGEVHDENAYALGGIAGHAGLFSSAADLSIFAQTLLNGGQYAGVRVFADSTVRLFTRRAAGTRALGWDTCNNRGSCGSMMGENAFGHTGFTGTSLWMDPERNMFVVLLTNRVHEARARRPAKVIADVRADLSDAAELAVLDDPRGVRDMPASFRADDETDWNRAPERARSSHASRSRGGSRKHAGSNKGSSKHASKGRHESGGSKHHSESGGHSKHSASHGSSHSSSHASKSSSHGHSSKHRG